MFAHTGGMLATGLTDVTSDLSALDSEGFWAVVVTYEGKVTCARFADVREAPLPHAPCRRPPMPPHLHKPGASRTVRPLQPWQPPITA